MPARKNGHEKDSFFYLLKSNWRKYVLEIVIIIFSITVSFYLSNWNEERQEKEMKSAYVRNLDEDLTADIAELEQVIKLTGEVLDASGKLKAGDALPDSLFRKYLMQASLRPNFVSKDATVNELKGSGNLRLFSDVEFKNRMLEYYRFYEAVLLVQNNEASIMTEVMGSFLFQNIQLDETSPRPASTAVKKSVMFDNFLVIRRLNRNELLRDYHELLQMATQIKQILEENKVD